MKKKKNSRLAILAAALAVAIGLGTWWFLDYTRDDGLIYPNVQAYGLELGGMNPEDAAATLRLIEADSYRTKTMTVRLPDRELNLTPEQTGVTLDVEALVKTHLIQIHSNLQNP